MRTRNLALMSGLILVLVLPSGAQTLTVSESTNGKVVRHTQTLTRVEAAGLTTETLVTPEGTIKRTFDATGALRSVDWTGPAGNYTLVSDGKTVKAQGTYLGKPVTGTVEVGGKLWDRGGGQLEFSVAFRALAKQGFRGPLVVLTISPDDVTHPVEMAFSKEAEEVIGGRTMVRVKLGLTGFLALLWSGQAWLDPITGQQLRLKSSKGPGTPEILYVTEMEQ